MIDNASNEGAKAINNVNPVNNKKYPRNILIRKRLILIAVLNIAMYIAPIIIANINADNSMIIVIYVS